MNSFFVGNKTKPSFLVELLPGKIIRVYKPDKYSKHEEFYERYSLGEMILKTKYNTIHFKNPIPYKNNFYVPEITVKIKNKHFVLSKTITEKIETA